MWHLLVWTHIRDILRSTSEQLCRGRNRISIDDLLYSANEGDVIETESTASLASIIVETLVLEDGSQEEGQEVVEITVEEKLNILAKARHVLDIDSADMMTGPVERQIGRAQRVLRSERPQAMSQTLDTYWWLFPLSKIKTFDIPAFIISPIL